MPELSLPSSETIAEVLVVDDEPMMADLLQEWVREKWRCEAVYNGSDALEIVSENIDVVLLDRQMPDFSGEEVLRELRTMGLDCQVMFISGVEPDPDVLELPFDDYLMKPVERPSLQEAIEALLIRRSYHPVVQEFFSAVAKIELLQDALSPRELADDERYLALRREADELRQTADATLGQRTQHVEEIYDVEADD
ncbi:MAG: response regulator [Halobacteriales archaeon]